MTKLISFEYIGPDKILFKEGGRVVEAETLDNKAYAVYVCARDRCIDIIPTPYYKVLRDDAVMVDLPFDQSDYDATVLPKIGEAIDKVFYSFQRHTVYRMIKKKKSLNACSPGLGKTIQALSSLKYFNDATTNDIILCPSYLRANWLDEIKKWFPDLEGRTTIIWAAGKKDIDEVTDIIFNRPGIKVLSYDMFATICGKFKKSASIHFNTFVLDESHSLKSGSSIRYKNTSLYIKKAKQVFLLSGTPSPNRPNELYTQFSLINPHAFYDYRTFAYRYCDGKMDKFNRFDDRGSSNTSELAFLMSKMSLRLRREDNLVDLPAIIRQRVTVTPKTVSKTFGKKKAVFMETLRDMDNDESSKFKAQAMVSELFRDTAVIKVAPVLEYLDNYIDTPNIEKTILFCKHQIMMSAVTEFLTTKGLKYIEISGKTPMKGRLDSIKTFIDDDVTNFAVLTTGSCYTGLNIVPIRKMIFLELEWSPSTLDQCEGRINRIGGARQLHYVYILCEHTLDGMVYNKLKKKTALITEVVDDGVIHGDFEFDEDEGGDGDGDEGGDGDTKKRKIY
jgi:SWI/SNF-related matrix-associated actin-dependent regulator 1 of chromatin subfamily A